MTTTEPTRVAGCHCPHCGHHYIVRYRPDQRMVVYWRLDVARLRGEMCGWAFGYLIGQMMQEDKQ